MDLAIPFIDFPFLKRFGDGRSSMLIAMIRLRGAGLVRVGMAKRGSQRKQNGVVESSSCLEKNAKTPVEVGQCRAACCGQFGTNSSGAAL
jgi:hypothetical protein